MTARIDLDLPFEDYLRDPSYGSGDIKAYRQGPPARVPWGKEHRSPGSESTRIGIAAHCRILTPDLFAATYAFKPEGMSFATKDGKAWRDDNEGKEILTFDEAQAVRGAVAAFLTKLPAAESVLEAVAKEASLFWDCPTTGLPCKARPDWFDADAVYDLKVSIVADRSDSERVAFAAHRAGWFHQLAHNRAGLHLAGYRSIKLGRNVIVSPTPPHVVWLIEVSENDLDLLELENMDARRGMAECHRTGHWPGTPDSWQKVELPASAEIAESDLEGAVEQPSEGN